MTPLTPNERTTLAALTPDQLAAVEQIVTTRFAHLDEYVGKVEGFYLDMSAAAERYYGGDR